MKENVKIIETDKKNIHYYKLFLKGILNPASIMEQHNPGGSSYLFLIVSAFAYLLFFLQVGIDKLRAEMVQTNYIIKLSGVGFIVGYLGVLLISTVVWVLIKLVKGDWSLSKVIGCMAISHGSTLVYMILGVLAQLILGWNTALAFGVTGLLWSLFPIANSIKLMTKNNIKGTVIITTIVGLMLMFVWNCILTIV